MRNIVSIFTQSPFSGNTIYDEEDFDQQLPGALRTSVALAHRGQPRAAESRQAGLQLGEGCRPDPPGLLMGLEEAHWVHEVRGLHLQSHAWCCLWKR